MIAIEWVLQLGGTPVPKGSLKCIGSRGARRHVLIEDNERTKPWRDDVARVARHLIREHAAPGEAIGVEITSTLARPQLHYGTGRNAGQIRPGHKDAQPTGHGTGDVDKLARLVLDALQDATVLADDAQVIEVISRKAYAHPDPWVPDGRTSPGITIRIYPIPWSPA